MILNLNVLSRRHVIFTGLTALLATTLVRAEPQVWTGTIGKEAVVMELDIDQKGDVSGRYYHKKDMANIAFRGRQAADGSLSLAEDDEDFYDDKEHLPNDMKLHPDIVQHPNQWRGKWHRHEQGQVQDLQVTLTPYRAGVHIAKFKLNDTLSNTLYDKIRLSTKQLKPQKQTRFGHYDLQWLREPTRDISSFRIMNGYPRPVMKQLNKYLSDQQWNAVAESLDCIAPNKVWESSQHATPLYMSRNVISIKFEHDEWCGQPHPQYGFWIVNFNARNGSPIVLEDVYSPLQDPSKAVWADNDEGRMQRYEYYDKILHPWLTKTMTQLYPKKIIGEDCDYRDGYWNPGEWSFTARGIRFGAGFSFRLVGCEDPDWAIIPWKIVNQHPGRIHRHWP